MRDGDTFRGGPAYYMERGLNARWLGILFSFLITIGIGLVFSSLHVNTITVAFEEAFNINRLLLGSVITVVVAVLIFGGVKRIAAFTAAIVPVMAIVYLGVAFYSVLTNFGQIPELSD